MRCDTFQYCVGVTFLGRENLFYVNKLTNAFQSQRFPRDSSIIAILRLVIERLRDPLRPAKITRCSCSHRLNLAHLSIITGGGRGHPLGQPPSFMDIWTRQGRESDPLSIKRTIIQGVDSNGLLCGREFRGKIAK